MPSKTEELIAALPDDRKEPVTKLRNTIKKNLPKGFEETVSSGMINWVVPHKTYPDGYHCDPKQPLPVLSLASQKGGISLYHMGIYSDPELLKWFQNEWAKASKRKLDMGKSCVRFKKTDDIPFGLIGELVSRMTPAEWIETYESAFQKK